MSFPVAIEIRGPAHRVNLYVIDERILERLKRATVKDALYEDNPLSLVGNIAKRSFRVTEGFCIHKADASNIALDIDGNAVEIVELGVLEKDFGFKELFDSDRTKTLFASWQTTERLGEGFLIEPQQIFVVEVQNVKFGKLTCTVNSASQITIEDIELGVVDLDADTDISRATYGIGLLDGMDSDIRYLVIKGEKHPVDMEVVNSYPSDFYLVRKSNGQWQAEYLHSDSEG